MLKKSLLMALGLTCILGLATWSPAQATETLQPDQVPPAPSHPTNLTRLYTTYYQGQMTAEALDRAVQDLAASPDPGQSAVPADQISPEDRALYKAFYARQTVQPAETGGRVLINGREVSPDDQAAGISLVGDTSMIGDWLLPRLHFSANRDGLSVTVRALNGAVSQWTLGETAYQVNQTAAAAPAAPYLSGPYFYLPLRSLVETAGTVNWSDDSRSIAILTPTQVLKPDQTLATTVPAPALTAEAPQTGKVIDRLPDGTLLTGDAQVNSGGYSRVFHQGRPILTGKNQLGVLTNPSLIPTADRLVWQESASADSPGQMPFNLYEAPLADPCQTRLIADQLYPDIDLVAANETWIVYTRGLKDKTSRAQLIAYNRQTGQRQTIDTLQGAQRYYLDLQLDKNRVVWTIGQNGWSEGLFLCDLAKPQAAKMISEGYAFRGPILKGRHLVASRNIQTLKGRKEEVWHYDLQAGRWTWRLDPTLDLLPQSDAFTLQKVLFSDHYLALCPLDLTGNSQASMPLSVLDLETGHLAPLALNEGTLPLVQASQDRPGMKRVSAIRPAADGSLHLQTNGTEAGQADSLFITID